MSPCNKVLLSSLPSYLGALSFGFMIGYTSPSLPKMQELNEPLHGKENSAAWFSSLATIGGMIGCSVAGMLVDKIGRRKTLLLTSFPFVLGWLGISLGRNLMTLNFSRLLTGLGGGMVCVVSPLYVSETSSKEMRGKYGTAVQLFVTIGIVVVYACGVVLGWRTLAAFCSIFSVASFLYALYIPETPRYLLNQGHKKEAHRVLILLRETSSLADDELRDMEEASEETNLSMKEFLTPELYRPLIVAVVVMIFQQLTGINVVMFYTVSIFISAGFKEDQSTLATCLVGLVQVVATLIAAVCMDRAGRRRLLLIAGAGMCFSCFAMSTCFHFQPITPASDDLSVTTAVQSGSRLGEFVLASLVIYTAAFALGWGPVPMLLASEIFPSRARGPAVGAATFTNWFFAFLVTLYFDECKAVLGMDGVFALFGLFCILAIVYVWHSVPETKGRSLEDISFFFNVRSARSI